MKILLIICSILVAVFIAALYVFVGNSYSEVTIYDLSQSKEMKVSAPLFPFMDGSLYVNIIGDISGKGNLHIYSNYDRDHQVLNFENEKVNINYGGPEYWVDDLKVVWEPIDVKGGTLSLFLRCGGGYKKYTQWLKKYD